MKKRRKRRKFSKEHIAHLRRIAPLGAKAKWEKMTEEQKHDFRTISASWGGRMRMKKVPREKIREWSQKGYRKWIAHLSRTTRSIAGKKAAAKRLGRVYNPPPCDAYESESAQSLREESPTDRGSMS